MNQTMDEMKFTSFSKPELLVLQDALFDYSDNGNAELNDLNSYADQTYAADREKQLRVYLEIADEFLREVNKELEVFK